MDDLLADFVAESREMLEALASEMVEWEANPTDRDRLDNIFRFFHTVKGNCGFFDFPRLEALSHAAEDALSDLRTGSRKPDRALVDAVLAVIDRIALMVDAIDAGKEFPDGGDETLIAALAGNGTAADGEQVVDLPQTSGEGAGQGGSAAERTSANARSIRLSVDLLDRIMSGISDMTLARNELVRRLDTRTDDDINRALSRLSTLLDDVREAITHTRMQRIETLFSAFPRLVRDLSSELGRQVMVELESGDVELDREMVELIRDPLVHVIRNAIDHGIETPAERRAAGKREIGMLTIWARQAGNEIRIGINDDGRGIDTDRLVEKAIAAGVVTADGVADMSEAARLMLVCEPGLSTSDTITSVSGRGVGMDVVHANLARIGGSLEIQSTRGSGTRIVLKVPLTLSIVPSLTVRIGDTRFAIPRSYVDEVVRIRKDDAGRAQVGDRQLVTVRDRRIPCLPLSEVLDTVDTSERVPEIMIVIRLVGGNKFALAVDSIHDHEELVIKPLPPLVMDCGYYAGTAQLDDGEMVLMLDVSGVARNSGLDDDVERVDGITVEQTERVETARTVPALQFVAMDGCRKVMPMSAVRRLETVGEGAIRASSGEAQVVLDEKIVPLVGLADGKMPAGKVQILRLLDGSGSEVAYAFAEMIGITSIDGALAHGGDTKADVAGVALIDGKPVEVVDCHAVFADHARDHASATAPVCLLPGDDAWCQDFLRPLVEAAGYRVVDKDDAQKVDLAIAFHGSDTEVPANAGRSVILRHAREAGEDAANTIYRYDREALKRALRAVAAGEAA
ncbi:chemotaxis protein CheA [Tsuneonella mangrovi]|uniref:chemotaxis protein CheA n=1 Tax=Tsuneonella mangrovi TaxID=1982042 RepID=UPI000BA23360|nr:chemotaxis protein CheA [Tsuneonella mangrovi]